MSFNKNAISTKTICIALLTGVFTGSGCTSQQLFKNEIYLLNTCGQTLQIVVANDSNIDLPGRAFSLAPGARNLIGFYNASRKEHVADQVQDGYRLNIGNQSDVSIEISAAQLKNHLRQITELDDGTARQWIVEGQWFCPDSRRL